MATRAGRSAAVQRQSDPARRAPAITPSDTVDLLGGVTRGLFIGVGGDVTVIMDIVDGDDPDATVTFQNVNNGQILPIAVRRVLATGTDAEAIVALR